jgi:hypothetical protein
MNEFDRARLEHQAYGCGDDFCGWCDGGKGTPEAKAALKRIEQTAPQPPAASPSQEDEIDLCKDKTMDARQEARDEREARTSQEGGMREALEAAYREGLRAGAQYVEDRGDYGFEHLAQSIRDLPIPAALAHDGGRGTEG